jgi:hypothetical protein
MSTKGITAEVARAFVPLLDLLLATPAIDADTERRIAWLRLRLVEIGGLPVVKAPDLMDLRIGEILSREPVIAS